MESMTTIAPDILVPQPEELEQQVREPLGPTARP